MLLGPKDLYYYGGHIFLIWHQFQLLGPIVPLSILELFRVCFPIFDSENTFTTYIEKQFGQSRQYSFQETASAVYYNLSDN